jgi:hypothetical protein
MTPSDLDTPDEKSMAYLDGWSAKARGLPYESNPYNEATQRISFINWAAGWGAMHDELKHRRQEGGR